MPVYTKLYGAFVLVLFVLYFGGIGLLRQNEKRITVYSQALLFLAGLVFYAYAGVLFVPVLLYECAAAWGFGLLLSTKRTRVKKGIAVFCLLLPLLLFKYLRYLLTLAGILSGTFFLPLGISFFTLQSITYVLAVAGGELPAEKNPLPVALFVSFFPSISSGPILRAKQMLPQFGQVRPFDYEAVTDGLKVTTWGLFQKLVIADNLVPYIVSVKGAQDASGTAQLLAAVLYSFQLYLDFSGYSCIVIGTAQLFGFRIPQNFDHPYLSESVSEFWHRWHISLSSYLRDYVYFPLGGSRVREGRIYCNLLLTFLISGIWHGNGMTFIIWGLLHGLFICLDRLWKKRSVILTFLLVTIAWVFFAAASVKDALLTIASFIRIPGELLQLVAQMKGGGGGTWERLATAWNRLVFPEADVFLLQPVVFLLLFCGISLFTKNHPGLPWIRGQKPLLRWSCYLLLIGAVLFFHAAAPVNFIYNQF